ncbi:hypothetical protein [Seonamhaeicola marinus]|uniref:Uncharacterized protein n=1 Tax=Seonamhaeicola marinus TaxID=1912246 RepID=A0A5D0HN32_9FLAO|nr:hypothetical protein [Seonamhaeicola marinus]TYA71759.1 hypothetical protein FUA24_19595 [Seonamhaeicola marinus]
MKIKVLIGLILFTTSLRLLSQTKPGEIYIYPKDNELKIMKNLDNGAPVDASKFEYATDLRIFKNENDLDNIENAIFIFNKCAEYKDDNLVIKADCKKGIFEVFLNGNEEKTKLKFWYCENNSNWKFTRKEEEYTNCLKSTNESESTEDEKKTDYTDIVKMKPLNLKVYANDESFDKQNRILKISANKSSVRLLKQRKGDEGVLEKEAKAVSTKGNVIVLLRNYNIKDIEKITVSMNEKDFVYNMSFDISNPKDSGDKPEKEEKEEQTDSKPEEVKSTSGDITAVTKRLKEDYDKIKNIDILNKEDYVVLKNYQSNLKAIKEKLKQDLDLESKALYEKIIKTSPDWIVLNPIPDAIKNSDKVEISVVIDRANKTEDKILVGSYLTIGGLSYDGGGNFFITGLRNNKVFTDSITVGDSKELRARIGNKNQTSLGYGLSGEVSFRTGSLIRPTLNIGAFVPFEEDISPYLALGPGVSLTGEKVKIRFAAGLAYGKVNAISEQYIDRDLSSFSNLTNENLVEKVWDSSWYISFGIRYVFKKDDKD